MMQNQQQLQNNIANDQINNEAVRVELASRAGGMLIRELVKQGEQLLSQGNIPVKK